MEIQNYFINLDKVIFVEKNEKQGKIKIVMIGHHIITLNYYDFECLNDDYDDLILALL